ncbi:MAG: hypothetical protein LUD17_00335 [Bacteroidales bacterium]|nr:hypothetical protein [Bacteroidales bacterium]
MITKFKFLMVAIIAALSLTSCSEDEPAKMLWEVSATRAENVKAAFDPSFYHQIQITADGNGGEATLVCTNYKTLVLKGQTNSNGEYVDADCHFTAKVVGNGTIKITFNKMPDGFKETKSILQIDGTEGQDSNTTNIDIIRKP